MNILRSRGAGLSLLILLFLGFGLFVPMTTQAGVFDEDTGTTYKEYWINHDEFTGACGDDERPLGSFYVEPSNFGVQSCIKILEFEIPDNFINAKKLEVFMDIWRGHDDPSVRFWFNGGPNVHQATVGSDWSRTPFVKEIPKSELQQGTNTIRVWKANRAYHIHDIAIRIYYDNANQLIPGNNSDVAAPTGELYEIVANNVTYTATVPGTLDIDNDKITLRARNLSPDAKFVEFFAFYDGYDEDNDGRTRDWHGRTRLQCHPGGRQNNTGNIGGNTDCPGNPNNPDAANPGGLYATIDHIGTLKVDGSPPYSIDWNIPHVTGQTGVKFKIRVLDAAGNARDAASVSAPFTLKRDFAVATFMVPGFEDAGLHMDGTQPGEIVYDIDLPADVETYDEGYIVGSYWKNPQISLNDKTGFKTFDNGVDQWPLGITKIPNFAYLENNANTIKFTHLGGFGSFIERPGPMIVLRRTGAAGPDGYNPWVHREDPIDNSVGIPIDTNISVQVYDSESGINKNSIKMFVDTGSGFTEVTPQQITGDKYNYKVIYNPPTDFGFQQDVTVKVDVADNNGRTGTKTFSFTTKRDSVPANVVSDDFNYCVPNPLWTFADPIGDATYMIKDNQAEITVPAGTAHDLWNNVRNQAPRLMQMVDDGDFDVVVKFSPDSLLPLDGAVRLQGLIIGNNTTSTSDGDFVRFDVESTSSLDLKLFMAPFINGQAQNSLTKSKVLTGRTTPPEYLRVTRDTLDWNFYYSDDGSTWILLETMTTAEYTITVSELGVFAGNAGSTAQQHTAIVDYIFNKDAPIEPEDGLPLSLPVSILPEGSGSVSKNVECGNPVTLTATANPGWQFDSYSGSISWTEPVTTVTYAVGDEVIGNFTREYYTLDTNVVDENGVPHTGAIIDPTPPTVMQGYVYTEVIDVAITPNPGWTFVEWRGDLTGAANPASLTMSGSKAVTATVTQDHYTVTLKMVDENGQDITTNMVAASAPTDPEGFVYNESGVYTATAQAGWTFMGWESDTGFANTANPLTLPITGTQMLSAIFMEDHYKLNYTIVDETGAAADAGTVTVSAPQDPNGHVYNESATITVAPKDNWLFARWEGDLTGTTKPTRHCLHPILNGDRLLHAAVCGGLEHRSHRRQRQSNDNTERRRRHHESARQRTGISQG